MDIRHLSDLKYLSVYKCNKAYCSAFLHRAPREFIECLCEIIKNVLLGNIAIDKNRKFRLAQHKETLRDLADKSCLSPKQRRRKILEISGPIASLISYLLPELTRRFAK
jgi:hypothetical protein